MQIMFQVDLAARPAVKPVLKRQLGADGLLIPLGPSADIQKIEPQVFKMLNTSGVLSANLREFSRILVRPAIITPRVGPAGGVIMAGRTRVATREVITTACT